MANLPFQEGTIPFDVPSTDGLCSTHYKIFGDISNGRPRIVILHGGPGAGHEYLLPFTSLWSRYNFPVVFYDQIGCASSTHLPQKAGDKSFWQESLFIAELENLLDRLQLRDGPGFHLLGQSWGGMLGAAFAASRPRGLQRLILASALASKELSIQSVRLLRQQLPLETQQTLAEEEQEGNYEGSAYKDALGVFQRKHLCRVEPFPPDELMPALKHLGEDKTVYGTMNGPSPLTSTGSLLGWTVIPRLSKINVPTLVYNGEFDSSHDVGTIPFFENIPRVRWITFAGAGHMCHLEGEVQMERILNIVATMASSEGETASDIERRRARRRERRARRAERHAKRGSTSPVKNRTAVSTYPLDDNTEPERVRPPSSPPKYTESPARTVHDPEDLHLTIDSHHAPPTIEKPAPAELIYSHRNRHDAEDSYDLDPDVYNDRHVRGNLAYPQHKERYDGHSHGHKKRLQQRDHEKRSRKRNCENRERHYEPPGRQCYDEKHRSHHAERSYESFTDEYKAEEDYAEYKDHRSRRWSWKKKVLIFGIPLLLIFIIILAVAIAVSKKHSFKYTPSYVQVTNSTAFTNGGASRNANNTDDGRGAGQDRYIYYSGPESQFPPKGEWVSFADMWTANKNVIQNSCKILGYGKNNNDDEVTDIFNAIQSRASASLVDHRFILAVVLQESHGCVHIPPTNNGVQNPGLMQSHNGASFSSSSPSQSILQMVQDGTQGTKTGPGLAQHLNTYGNAYSAARMYNSGVIAEDGDLSKGNGATACYVSDVANRLTGWVNAKSTCPGDTA
ncbi:MAG: hypothetical protein Q9227_002067 [Pyrenula ochraceoflavens]